MEVFFLSFLYECIFFFFFLIFILVSVFVYLFVCLWIYIWMMWCSVSVNELSRKVVNDAMETDHCTLIHSSLSIRHFAQIKYTHFIPLHLSLCHLLQFINIIFNSLILYISSYFSFFFFFQLGRNLGSDKSPCIYI